MITQYFNRTTQKPFHEWVRTKSQLFVKQHGRWYGTTQQQLRALALNINKQLTNAMHEFNRGRADHARNIPQGTMPVHYPDASGVVNHGNRLDEAPLRGVIGTNESGQLWIYFIRPVADEG